MGGRWKETVNRALAAAGLRVQRLHRGRANPIHLWDEDRDFSALMEEIRDRTLVDRTRCFMLYQFCSQVKDLPGDAAEIGVYRGGTARLIARLLHPTSKTLHLFDTFEGMPETDPQKDFHKAGDFHDTSLKSVSRFLDGFERVRFHPGFFPQTAKPVDHGTFCLVHVDVDIYQSVRDCCEFFYPRMAKGGLMVFDDYGFLSCPGAKLAVDEFFAGRPEVPCYLPTGQCLVTRR